MAHVTQRELHLLIEGYIHSWYEHHPFTAIEYEAEVIAELAFGAVIDRLMEAGVVKKTKTTIRPVDNA